MSDYASNATYADLARSLAAAQRVLITSHQKPDGDAMGSVLALHRALAARGQQAEIFLVGPIEPCLLEIAAATPYRFANEAPPGEGFDLAAVLDTGSWAQLGEMTDWIRAHRAMVIGLDHHPHGEDVAAHRVVDPSCASTTQMLLTLLDEMQCPVTGGPGSVAEALFVGLATDTGWFRYGNADAAAFQTAGRLLACGVDKVRLYQVIEESHRPARLGLEARALSSLELGGGGAAAVMTLRRRDFDETGGSLEDLTGLVNMPLIVGTIRVSILLVEAEDGRTKMSFRSKPARVDGQGPAAADVNRLAQHFGGGGHTHAAGAWMEKSLEAVRAEVLEAVEQLGASD